MIDILSDFFNVPFCNNCSLSCLVKGDVGKSETHIVLDCWIFMAYKIHEATNDLSRQSFGSTLLTLHEYFQKYDCFE